MDNTYYLRQKGLIPNWAWYQLNGKSAQENWMEQRGQLLKMFAEQDSEDDAPQMFFSSEVKVK